MDPKSLVITAIIFSVEIFLFYAVLAKLSID
jgi:hypothetical protein